MKALAVTASVLLAALGLGIGWLTFSSSPDMGEPVAIIPVDPSTRPAPQSPPAPAAENAPDAEPGTPAGNQSFALPPGFIIALPPGAAPAPQPEPEAAQPQRAPQQPELPPTQEAAVPGPSPPAPDTSAPEALAPGAPTPQVVAAPPPSAAPISPQSADPETGSIPLPPVPVAELVEDSQYGPLPKVAPDGRRPLEIYARPSRYAVKAEIGAPARIAVLVNGMGLSDSATGDAIKGLPAPISVAYGAYGRNLQDWVTKARAAGHEVLLQVPLEPFDYPNNDPGPHTLLTTLPPEENMKRLQWLMSRFTGYVGLTNNMGGKFEAAQDAFLPVLEELKARGLLYLDDGTAQRSTAGQIASTLGLDYSVAQVQIDGVQSPGDIAKALARLEALAKERGCAIGVASAKPATVKQLAEWAEKLQGKGIVLVPVSAAVRSQRQS